MYFNKISVFGLGYIGLPTAAIFASRKHKVIGIDVNEQAIETINRGDIHIVEPGLNDVVRKAVKGGYLRASSVAEPADAFLLAVPTPFKGDDHEPDVSYIKAACEKLAPVLEAGNLVILESTSPVGTTQKVSEWLAALRKDLTFPHDKGDESDVRVAYCPERVLPGQVLNELISNDRIIGGMTQKCAAQACALYESFLEGECFVTNAQTAEMTKLTENSFRDVNIAFANELSIISDKLNINVWELVKLANRHPRVNILQPGPGVGGHCIAVDPWFIVNKTPDEARIIRTAREINDYKPKWVVNKIQLATASFLQKNPEKTAKHVSIAFFGLAFKANIDDLRESPAIKIMADISYNHPGKVVAVEPNIKTLPEKFSTNVQLLSIEAAMDEADIFVLLVDHKEFKNLLNHSFGNDKIIIDTRGSWSLA